MRLIRAEAGLRGNKILKTGIYPVYRHRFFSPARYPKTSRGTLNINVLWGSKRIEKTYCRPDEIAQFPRVKYSQVYNSIKMVIGLVVSTISTQGGF